MKSVEVKLNEAIAALTKANLMDKFNEKFTNKQLCPIEVQLNGALSLLKEKGIVESITEESGWGLTFTEVAPRRVPKKNGAGGTITEADRKRDTKKEALVESVMKSSNLTEAGARAFLGLKVKLPEGLTKLQEVEFTAARRLGLSESDAMTLAKMPLGRTR